MTMTRDALPLLAGIEAGGTKFVLALGTADGTIVDRASIPTTTPQETLGSAIDWFKARAGFAALGVASFGPLVLDPQDPKYGHFAPTPKPGWSEADLVGPLKRALGVPVGLDTDVNGAGLGEARLGAGRGFASIAYITIGTGLGGGLILDGKPVHGLTHPEMGHMKPRMHPSEPDFAGVCPYHGTCIEGLVSGPAVMKRLGYKLSDAAPDHPIWEVLGFYIGEFCANLVLIASPQRIILGGGVMSNSGLFPPVRRALVTTLNGYVGHPAITSGAEDFIVPPGLGDNAGAVGALLLAEQALDAANQG